MTEQTGAARHAGYVAIVGRPNVGKSTLLNRLIGQKLAITSHKAQTTRHTILGIRTLPTGQIVYIDTPGIHKRGESALNRYLNRAARALLADADLALFVVRANAWNAEDQAALEALQLAGLPVVAVVNKVDRVEDKSTLLPYLDELSRRHEFVAVVPVSAKTGDNLPGLEQVVLRALPEGDNLFPEDQVTDRSERFFAAELLREQLTRRYHQEIPYTLTVEIEHFEEAPGLYRIAAVVWVERPAHKRILIGQGGTALKAAATAAREAMERMFDTKVFLQVWVKVKASWSSDEATLASLGYTD
jgi:GTP-binding protein Era